jgi:hypothetical protein
MPPCAHYSSAYHTSARVQPPTAFGVGSDSAHASLVLTAGRSMSMCNMNVCDGVSPRDSQAALWCSAMHVIDYMHEEERCLALHGPSPWKSGPVRPLTSSAQYLDARQIDGSAIYTCQCASCNLVAVFSLQTYCISLHAMASFLDCARMGHDGAHGGNRVTWSV